ncbi:uncharacterized protein VP01_5420g1 [Puccinia sorghi]|uniref:CCHC-type domain-containing protein n=1 Tax=Puccinia sorghi TaxID=27349 RepID=A0A0L6ULR4_9BASI|nr:uncharacterized protein VP01_5420g1 [Puccinia sorghi]
MPNTTNHRNQSGIYSSCGHPGAPSAEEIFAAVGNIKRGNQPPPPHLLAWNNSCTYCSSTGHWRSNCPVLQRDTFLLPPSSGRSDFAFARPAPAAQNSPTVWAITNTPSSR